MNHFAPYYFLIAILFLGISCDQGEEKTETTSSGQNANPQIKVHSSTTNNSDPKQENLLTEHIMYHVEIKDMDENADWWYSNMRYDDREKFISTIIGAIRSEKLIAYLPALGMPTNDSKSALTVQQVDSMLHPRDTVYMEDIETNAINPVPVELNYENDELIRVTFIEEWYFDSEKLQMEKKVNGLALAHSVYNQDGTLRGYKPLFYVWFNEVNLEEII